MDWTVYPKTRISKLPLLLRPPALVARNLVHGSPDYVYEADGLATEHFSPFLEDEEFDRIYWDVEKDWIPTYEGDFRWRMWILTRLARHCRALRGDFAEFGVYRAGATKLVLSTASLPKDKKFHLFDTFAGIPDSGLGTDEKFAGNLDNTSPEHVRSFLDQWSDQIELHVGDVFETVTDGIFSELAYVHLDLNGAKPTVHVLEHVYPKLVPAGIMVFDDYGWAEFAPQRAAVDRFFEGKPEEIIALPTGQGIVLKRSSD